MKFYTIVLLVLLVTAKDCFSQSKTHVGVVAGGNFSTVYFNHLAFPTNIRSNMITGVHGGLVLKHFHNKYNSFLNTGIQLEFNYSQKGYTQTFTNGHPPYNVHLNYVTIPFSGIIYAGKGKLKFFFSPGVFGEFIRNVNTNTTPEDDDPAPDGDDFINVGTSDVFPYDEDTDFTKGLGVKAELGLFRDFGFGIIHLAGEVNYSITNILNFGKRSSGIPETSNNIVVGFRIGYFISFGKLEL